MRKIFFWTRRILLRGHPRHGLRVWLGDRHAEGHQLCFGVGVIFGERIVFHDRRVISASDIFTLALFEDVSEHPQSVSVLLYSG